MAPLLNARLAASASAWMLSLFTDVPLLFLARSAPFQAVRFATAQTLHACWLR